MSVHGPDGHTHDVYLAEVGHATSCVCVENHRPTPERYVWHHVLPKTCGGRSTKDNLVSLCDTAHYAIHAAMWDLAQGRPLNPHENPFIRRMAQRGYSEAVAAGTVGRIPNPGEAIVSG